MGKKAEHFLVVYDIRETKRLAKVEKITANYCYRVQKSVMFSSAGSNAINKMKKQLDAIIEEEDFVLVFQICEKDFQKIEKYGKLGADEPMNAPYMIL